MNASTIPAAATREGPSTSTAKLPSGPAKESPYRATGEQKQPAGNRQLETEPGHHPQGDCDGTVAFSHRPGMRLVS